MMALIWKEWREQRVMVAVSFALLLVIRAIQSMLFSYTGNNLESGSWITLLPSVLAVIIGANVCTDEFTEGMKEFIFSRAVSVRRLFWAKYTVGLVATIVLSIAGLLPASSNPGIARLLLPVMAYSVAMLASILTRQTLLAIICVPAIATVLLLLTFPFIAQLAYGYYDYFPHSIVLIIIICTSLSYIIWQHRAYSRDNKVLATLAIALPVIFLLSVIGHTFFVVLEGMELNAALAGARKAGLRISAEELIMPFETGRDKTEDYYRQASRVVSEIERKALPSLPPYLSESLTPQQMETVAGLLLKGKESARALTFIEEATSITDQYIDSKELPLKKSCEMDDCYRQSYKLYGNAGRARRLERFMLGRSVYLTRQGKYAEALQTARMGLSLRNAVNSPPMIFTDFVEMACTAITMRAFQHLIDEVPAEGLPVSSYREIIDGAAGVKREAGEGLQRTFAGEIAYVKANFYSGTSMDLILATDRMPWYVAYLCKPSLRREDVLKVKSVIRLIDLVDQPYHSVDADLKALQRRMCGNAYEGRRAVPVLKDYSTNQDRDYLLNFMELNAARAAWLDGLTIAAALKIYRIGKGRYPDRLNELAPNIIPEIPLDPFTGKDFIYHREGRGFILCSLGANGLDDSNLSERFNARDDIVWRSSR